MTENNKRLNPLSDLIEQVQQIEKDAQTTLDKRYHSATAKQIEAVGRLIKTIKDLDSQNGRLEYAIYFLAAATLVFTINQTISNIWMSLSLGLAITIGVYFLARIIKK